MGKHYYRVRAHGQSFVVVASSGSEALDLERHLQNDPWITLWQPWYDDINLSQCKADWFMSGAV